MDYSLYLVTSSANLPVGSSLASQVELAIQGGVTIVQLREKNLDTRPFLRLARELRDVTRRHHVPLIINDRVDVALAVEADGVHVGQDDMNVVEVKRLIAGKGMVVGVSVKTVEEAKKAVEEGADYLGIGSVFPTNTKQLKTEPIGEKGVAVILDAIADSLTPTVLIGGITIQSFPFRLFSTKHIKKPASGVAVVSAIMSSHSPKVTASLFRRVLSGAEARLPTTDLLDAPVTLTILSNLLPRIKQRTPLVHVITNFVVANDNANALLALGASPIMSNLAAEAEDLASVSGALVVNMGTVDEKLANAMTFAAKTNNKLRNPVVLDPVAAGATSVRRELSQRLMTECRIDIVKGNHGEVLTLAGKEGRMRGVDSDDSGSTVDVSVLKQFALRDGIVVAMTGKVDYVTDGRRAYAIENGHEYLGRITGSGCMAGALIGCFAAVEHDYLLAAIGGLVTLGVAGELAAERKDVLGPGTFRTALIDELYGISQNPSIIAQMGKIRAV